MPDTSDLKSIVIVSDGTGQTARRLMDAVLAQYEDQQVAFSVVKTYQQVRTKTQVDHILHEIKRSYLVVFSIISDDLRAYLHDKLEKRGNLHLNVLEPMLVTMSKFLGIHPDYKPGLLQIVDDRYYRKIDAIGYTVEHDDGRGSRQAEAELLLVGPSRSCKTPLSMYIACNFGLKVANIPIVPRETMTDELAELLHGVNKHIVIGLVMLPEEMARVRQERLDLLAGDHATREQLLPYYHIYDIRRELAVCKKIYHDLHWPVVDVTKRAIEEVAEQLLRTIHYPQVDGSHRS